MNVALVAAAVLTSVSPVVAADDHCAPGEDRVVLLRLDINNRGKPTDCHVEQSSRDLKLDEVSCEISLRRVRFKAARDDSGKPIASTYSFPVRWKCGDPPSRPSAKGTVGALKSALEASRATIPQ